MYRWILLISVMLLTNIHVTSQHYIDVNIFIINGVSSKEDVGGVECNALQPQHQDEFNRIQFTNYNNFNVSTLYKIEVLDDIGRSYKTGTVVLGKGETKILEFKSQTLGDIKLINRRIGSLSAPIRDNSPGLTMEAGYIIRYPEELKVRGRSAVSDLIQKFNLNGVYGRYNWRLPSDTELTLLNIDNSGCQYYSTDNWNRHNIHPNILVIVSNK